VQADSTQWNFAGIEQWLQVINVAKSDPKSLTLDVDKP
jgi:hypothetical protein